MVAVISCQFVFEPGTYDDDFNRLDTEIEAYAQGLPGFIAVHTWNSRDGKLVNAVYFFEDNSAIKSLAQFPAHLQAKSEVARWYKSYQIVVSEVTQTYGDGNLVYP